jgi:hypothetical protein
VAVPKPKRLLNRALGAILFLLGVPFCVLLLGPFCGAVVVDGSLHPLLFADWPEVLLWLAAVTTGLVASLLGAKAVFEAGSPPEAPPHIPAAVEAATTERFEPRASPTSAWEESVKSVCELRGPD